MFGLCCTRRQSPMCSVLNNSYDNYKWKIPIAVKWGQVLYDDGYSGTVTVPAVSVCVRYYFLIQKKSTRNKITAAISRIVENFPPEVLSEAGRSGSGS